MVKQVTVYRKPNHFAGWPANYGIWHWNKEIIVGFSLGHIDPSGGFHARDTSRPFMNVQSRSVDGGLTWQDEDFSGKSPDGRGLSADEHMNADNKLGTLPDLDKHLQQPPTPIDFQHPDFALMCARTGLEAGAQSFFYYSHDRCKNWQGPYALPDFGQTGIMARTDYIVESKHSMLLFLTANKANGREGKVICVRTTDGGMTWSLVSNIGEEPKDERDFAIMSASYKLSDGKILCAVRCHHADQPDSIDLYQSEDNAQSWQFNSRPVMFDYHSNPPTLNRLSDGRLMITYGNRIAPYTIEAKLSSDEGQTWGDPVILRSGAGNHDLGYPRTVVLEGDTVVTVYYINDDPDGERYIEASIWKP